uniref:CSON005226 protein n=1 Tax=Culicoides sonorensis TaxID=179676 RepID=A0A336MRD6_CULSO
METDFPDFSIYGNATPDNCLVVRRNRTLFFSVYEGIPETLLLNVITWILLILLFSLIRQQAWDYGRLALVNGRDSKTWTQLFFAQEYSELAKNARAQEVAAHGFIEKTGVISWIKMTLKLTKEQILAHSGPDAIHYLSFQEHLIFVMFIITVISLTVVLPVNLQGTLYANATTFGHTTISNLSPDSKWLWVHVFVAISFAPLIVLTMRRSSGRYASKTAPSRTIMAQNITKADCNRGIVKEYITERFADVIVEDVQLAYNISKLSDAAEEYHKVVLARHYCEDNRNRGAIKVTTDYWKCVQQDGLQFYREREIQLFAQVARLRSIALNEPLGIAFITVSSADSAQLVIKHFKPGTYRDWALSFAPNPSDIFWENLSDNTAGWYFRWIIVNLCLFVFLFFLTTPALIVNIVNTLPWYKEITTKISSLVSEFLPTLLLWTVSVVMPVVVGFSERFLKHWTKSKLNYTIMTKAFGYLLFMILILPSLGLTSAKAFLEWSINKREEEGFRFECIFLPDKGAFYVNYIITSAFIGTAAELLRFSELIYYFWQIITAKSVAEIPYVRRSILTEFPFGHHYSWMLIIFTVSVCYSIATPLIMPFAMVYICLKYLGDRYNLFFAYGPSNMVSQGAGKIHSTAVTLTKFSVIILFVNMAALSYVRNGNGFDARGILLTATLLITLALFTFMSPIKRCTTKPPRISPDYQATPLYVAEVLQDRRHFHDRPPHVDYGSDTASIVMTQGEEEISSIASA